jgi:hypothetical protein
MNFDLRRLVAGQTGIQEISERELRHDAQRICYIFRTAALEDQ